MQPGSSIQWNTQLLITLGMSTYDKGAKKKLSHPVGKKRSTFPSSIFTIIVILGLVCPLLSPHASQECTFFTRKEIIHVFNVSYKMGQEYEENKANEVRFNNNLRNIYLKIIFFCSLPQLHDAYTAVCILQIGLSNYMRMIMCR